MITEQELEMALDLNKEVKELKILIVKLEESKVSRNATLSVGITVEGCRIEVNDYTQNILTKLRDDLIHAHKVKLQELKNKYAEIIESPEDTLMRIVKEDG
jgi:hypothetical protein